MLACLRARSRVGALLVLAVVAGTTPAHAQDGGERAAAEVLFDQGKALVEHGHFAEACPKFAESLHLDPGLGTMLWLADCLENDGQTASAWAQFKEAAATAARKHDDRETIARERAQALEPRLPHLTITVPRETAAEGLEVRRDGIVIGDAEWGVSIPLDPGLHIVSATATGRQPWSTTVELPSRGSTFVATIPALGVPSAKPLFRQVLGLSLGGAGVAALGVGTYLSFHAKSTYDASNTSAHCLANNQCDATGTADRNDASSLATAATVVLVVGAAAVVGGAVLYLTAPRDHAHATALLLAPTMVPGGGGLLVRGGW